MSLIELLVVMVLLGVVLSAIFTVVVTTSRSNTYGENLRQVMDDGRVSLDRIRTQLRGGRRVLSATPYHLYWWTDQNQDGSQQTDERIHYCVAPLTSSNGNDCFTAAPAAGQYHLLRYTDADGPANARTIARTLVNASVFQALECRSGACAAASPVDETDTVDIAFDLRVLGRPNSPQVLEMGTRVRLRNVAYAD